jgi:predicted FMN-binding regulatory protein PaiB
MLLSSRTPRHGEFQAKLPLPLNEEKQGEDEFQAHVGFSNFHVAA